MALVRERDDDPREGTGWVPVACYGMVYEADFARATLESAGIPAHVHGSEHVGIFGPGWAGPNIRGLTVLVPAECLEEARELLSYGDAEEWEE
ncbi:MAG TPA: hypothetical protein VHG28_01395 [Longimicrobiaceae bacterium]|nr:hypothetical protein [Longimicrobiaceae bacterium]